MICNQSAVLRDCASIYVAERQFGMAMEIAARLYSTPRLHIAFTRRSALCYLPYSCGLEARSRRQVSAQGRGHGYMANAVSCDIHQDIKQSSGPQTSRVLSFDQHRQFANTNHPIRVLRPKTLHHEAHSIDSRRHGHLVLWNSCSANGTSWPHSIDSPCNTNQATACLRRALQLLTRSPNFPN
jgi:hypothetical protein